MASVDEALTARLAAVPALTALVGTRIYWKKLQQNTLYPALTYQKISRGPGVSAMGKDSGLVRPRYQITSFGKATATKGPKQVALEVAKQVRLALQRYRGTVAGVEIQDIFVDDERDSDDPVTEVAAVQTDVLVWAREEMS
jgi:hypothetical protein